MKMLSAAALVAACVMTTAASGQANPAAGAPPLAPSAPCCTLPALTAIEPEIVTPASSKTSVEGEKIAIRVAEPVSVGGQILVPAGTQGFAEVIQVSRAHMGGKAGELVIGAPYLMLGSQRIGLKRFRYGPPSGADRFNQAVVATALIGVAGGLIAGGNLDIPTGARANAVVTSDTAISIQ
jgi:hypothetical protein